MLSDPVILQTKTAMLSKLFYVYGKIVECAMKAMMSWKLVVGSWKKLRRCPNINSVMSLVYVNLGLRRGKSKTK